jgi:hypothetical protein
VLSCRVVSEVVVVVWVPRFDPVHGSRETIPELLVSVRALLPGRLEGDEEESL